MNIGSILEAIAASLTKAKATAASIWPRIPPVLAGELAAALVLLWTVPERPRTNLAIAVTAYLFARYGTLRLGSTPR